MAQKGVHFRTVVTFGDQGVSGHPNHISVANACLKYYEQSGDFDMYTLNNKPPNRGYMAFLTIFSSSSKYSNYYQWQPFVAMQALAIHETQFLWYRKLFMWFSSYVYHNELTYHPMP